MEKAFGVYYVPDVSDPQREAIARERLHNEMQARGITDFRVRTIRAYDGGLKQTVHRIDAYWDEANG